MEEARQEFDYLKEFVLGYLKKVDPKTVYYCKESENAFIFIKERNYLLCEKKNFVDSVFFAEVQIEWNETLFFPLIRKDTFNKLNIQELRDFISGNLSSVSEIKRLLKINKPVNDDYSDDDF